MRRRQFVLTSSSALMALPLLECSAQDAGAQAETRVREINTAYDQIKQVRGFK